MHRAHFTPCLHGVYIVHTLPVRVLREVVKMSSAFPRPTISAANGCAIIAAFPLNRLHNRMRPIDADRVYTSTAQVALTILLQNGDPMLIVELTRLLLQWLWFYTKATKRGPWLRRSTFNNWYSGFSRINFIYAVLHLCFYFCFLFHVKVIFTHATFTLSSSFVARITRYMFRHR